MLTPTPEWVTPELLVPGASLRFFAKLDDPEALLATVLTWLGIEVRRAELVFELHEATPHKATEDDWYDVAGEAYRGFLVELADPHKRHLYERYALERFFTRFNEPEVLGALGFSLNPQDLADRSAADRMAFAVAA